jgi:hypothetical protein
MRFATLLFTGLILMFSCVAQATGTRSIREFGVLPDNDPGLNHDNLQKAIDWAHPRGGALFVDPSERPYPVAGGLILRANASLIGVHGPVGRGTSNRQAGHPVGSMFAITDREKPFITVEHATQIRGIQFWYPEQTRTDPAKVIEYPATIQCSKEKGAQGVTLSCLTFYGEFLAMDFNASRGAIVEQILFEHCYGYPLGGEFIRIDYCYDIPRILHCHVNPANMRLFSGGFSRSVIDSVVARRTFTYRIDHTDNAQMMDVFTFGAYGGVYLGAASYGQLTNFNLDCVTVGIHKRGDSAKNRNWQIAQGSIIANTGDAIENIHPIIIDGQGHTALSNVEAFSGGNGALTTVNASHDYMLVRGDQKLTISLFGCRMRNYIAEHPFTIENSKALIQAVACIDKDEKFFNYPPLALEFDRAVDPAGDR